MLVLYSKEQIDKEASAEYNRRMIESDSTPINKPEPFQGEFGIVAVLGQNNSEEEPMKAETFDRNYMPIEFGGSGMKYPEMPVLNKNEEVTEHQEAIEKYKKEMEEIRIKRKVCVDFWKNHATVK